MARWATIFAVFVGSAVFGWAVPLDRLFDPFQPMITALSIMVAAVFVRLNRGMPTLEWKSVDPEQRKRLTSSVLELTIEYGWIVAINAAALLALLTLSVIGKVQATCEWPFWAQRLVAGGIGGVGALCTSRMAYVVWRDIDVVRLQKRLIDTLALRETDDRQRKLADQKMANIRAAGLRKIETPPPKAWGE